MFLKSRSESLELKLLRSLHTRTNLPEKSKRYYFNLEKGYEGELIFDEWLRKLPTSYLIINDLLLEHKNSYFQIDSLVISQKKINLFEVKNFHGDYYIDSGRWYIVENREEVNNPLLQMTRCETMLRTLLQNIAPDFTIEPYLVFVNPEFTLYEAPLNPPIIFPNQINRFMKSLNTPKRTEGNLKLSEFLVSSHLSKSPFTHVPKYDYDQLKKGITCRSCFSSKTSIDETICTCGKCGYKEDIEDSILRSVDEFQLLFPDKRITTSSVYDWCKEVKSMKSIRRILLKKYKRVGHGKYSYYLL